MKTGAIPRKATLALMDILLLAQVIMFRVFHISSKPEPLVNYVVTFTVLCMINLLTRRYFNTLEDKAKPDGYYYSILASTYIYAFFYTLNYTVPANPEYALIKTVILMGIYLLGFLMIVSYALYVVPFYNMNERQRQLTRQGLRISFVVASVFVLLNPLTHLMFRINADGTVFYPRTYVLANSYPIVLFAFEMIMLLRSKLDKATRRALLSYGYFAIFFVVIDALPFNATDIKIESGLALGAMFSVYTVFLQIFVQDKLELAKRTAELQQKRTQIMISQIQPHFLYNTLTAISALCEIDPELAQETIQDFSKYLRKNMDSLTNDNLVPFSHELEHTKIYLSIEKLRFQDLLHIEYDIECTDFSLPPLTLQPMVENAVKYGVRSRTNGGTVTIRTFREDGKVYIVVHDDGKGFNQMAVRSDSKEHVGIENTKYRLESMCGGTLNIESNEEKGTTVTIALEDRQ